MYIFTLKINSFPSPSKIRSIIPWCSVQNGVQNLVHGFITELGKIYGFKDKNDFFGNIAENEPFRFQVKIRYFLRWNILICSLSRYKLKFQKMPHRAF